MNRTPNLESAAVTARVISRLMRKAGFRMADTSNRYHWTEGFYVSRVGCGNHISIDYHMDSHTPYRAEERARRSEAWDKLRAFLKKFGYVRDEHYAGYWIECQRP